MKVYNKSKLLVENAKKVRCPKCKGNGCWLCRYQGKLWKSESGWTRPIGAGLDLSQLY